MQIDVKRTGEAAVVIAGGRLSASQAGRLHQALLQAFAGGGRVDLFLNEVQEADLTFLQLLCAAHRTAAANGVVFTLSGLESADVVRRLISEAGAERGVGCPDDCLWPGGSRAGDTGAAIPAQG